MNAFSHRRKARELLMEVDRTCQRHYHQSLRELVQDLHRHDILPTTTPTDDQLLKTICQSGVLRMSAAPEMARMQSLLERFTAGEH